jgi:hypothetical protein
MNSIAINKAAFSLLIMTLVFASSGCIVRVSDPVVKETELGPTSMIKASNTVGSIDLQGETGRVGMVRIVTEKKVSTYSFLGLLNPNEYVDSLETSERMENGVLTLSTEPFPPFFFWGFKIMPEVKRTIYSPVSMNAELGLNVGDLQVININGAVSADVNAGNCTLSGIAGSVQATVNAGNLEAEMIVGSIDADVNTGVINLTSDGLIGDNYLNVDAGTIQISLPSTAKFRYSLDADVGDIDAGGFNIPITRSEIVGAFAQGSTHDDGSEMPYISADVDVGDIHFSAR